MNPDLDPIQDDESLYAPRESVYLVMQPVIMKEVVCTENRIVRVFQNEEEAEKYAKRISAERFLYFKQERGFSGRQLDEIEELRPMDAFVAPFRLY